jgi:hypothetical protein
MRDAIDGIKKTLILRVCERIEIDAFFLVVIPANVGIHFWTNSNFSSESED